MRYGPHRQAMGIDFAAIGQDQAARGRKRTATTRSPGGIKRRFVDLADWGSVEGSTGQISAARHLPSLDETVVCGRHVAKGLGATGRGPRQARKYRLERDLYRWQLRGCKKRGPKVGPTKRGKGTKWMAIVDNRSRPVGIATASASPAEVKLVGETIESIPAGKTPERMIGDKAYDSDPLAQELWDHHKIELIAPNRENRKYKTQDGRPLRRYKRRWKVERFFAWLNHFRRLVVRWEQDAAIYDGFLYLACAIILTRSF